MRWLVEVSAIGKEDRETFCVEADSWQRALQIVREMGGRAVAVISDNAKKQFCLDHGAVGVINRNDFSHWGMMPNTESKEYGVWVQGARAFGKAIWDACGGEGEGDRLSAGGGT